LTCIREELEGQVGDGEEEGEDLDDGCRHN
jgi:hypothetical protein